MLDWNLRVGNNRHDPRRMAVQRINPEKPENTGGGAFSTPSGPKPLSSPAPMPPASEGYPVTSNEELGSRIAFRETLTVQVNDEPPMVSDDSTEETLCRNAKAWVTLTSVLGGPSPKWNPPIPVGYVITKHDIGIAADLGHLCRSKAIRPANPEEFTAFQTANAETVEVAELRIEGPVKLRKSLNRRLRFLRRPSRQVAVFQELMSEWIEAERQCRSLWQDCIARDDIRKRREVRRNVIKSEMIRKALAQLSHPVLISLAGAKMDAEPLHTFLAHAVFQEMNDNIPVQVGVEKLLRDLKYALLDQEKNVGWIRWLFTTVWGWVCFIVGAGVLTAVTVFVKSYLKSKGIAE